MLISLAAATPAGRTWLSEARAALGRYLAYSPFLQKIRGFNRSTSRRPVRYLGSEFIRAYNSKPTKLALRASKKAK